MYSIKGRHFRHDMDLTREETLLLFDLTKQLKAEARVGVHKSLLKNKTLIMYFEKPSTRTRLSFEVGMTQLGGHAIYMDPSTSQLSRGETIADTAKVISRYADGVMARVFKQEIIDTLAEYSTIPIINGLSDMYHPCQALADYFTILECFGKLDGINLAFVGDGNNNVTHSLMLTGLKLGVNVTVCAPKGYWPDARVIKESKKIASKQNTHLVITDDTNDLKSVDVIYTDVWVSMGRKDVEERKEAFRPYQVNTKLMNLAGSNTKFMHCLPAHRGEEVTNNVIDSENSLVWDEAENRMHTQKALLTLLL